ncbi:MAG: YfhO family protein, partial [Chloroflexi bacterium]|nr:YfhO family protein [Chloroflexota bacterium]
LGCNEQIAIPTTQTISIADAGFNRLDLFFASLPTHSDEKVDISIRHSDTNGRLFMQTTLDANTIPTDREQALFFAPIADSAGQTYVIDITSSSDEVALCGGVGEDGRFSPSYAAYATWLKAHEPVNDIWIYENRNVLPRAFMVHHVVQQDEADVLETLHSADFNWHHSAIMTDSLPAAHQAQLSDKPIRTDSQVVIQNYQGQTIDIFVETPTAGMVVLSDTYYPGWKATVDGKPTPIHQVDHTLRGIFVPPGAHQIQFTFQSNSLKIATFIAIISLLITAGIIGKQSLPKVRNQDDARTTFMA